MWDYKLGNFASELCLSHSMHIYTLQVIESVFVPFSGKAACYPNLRTMHLSREPNVNYNAEGRTYNSKQIMLHFNISKSYTDHGAVYDNLGLTVCCVSACI